MNMHLSSKLHEGIKMLYKDKCLTDVVIRVGSQTFPCHKLVLCAVSPYFTAMFTGKFQDKYMDEVTLESVTAETFGSILQYIYCSDENIINENNVQDLLSASSMLLIQHIQQECETFIVGKLSPENVINTWMFASFIACKNLEQSSKSFFLKTFEEAVQTDDFLELQTDQLSDIIKDQDLNVSREEKVADAVLRWFTTKEERSLEQLYEVLQHVRFPLIPAYYIFSLCKKFPILTQPGNHVQFIDEAKRFHSCGINQSGSTSLRFVQRTTSPWTDAMIYLCCNDDVSLSTHAYCFQEKKWKTLHEQFRGQGTMFASCIYRNEIYLSGGDTDSYGKILKFQFSENTWLTCSSLGDMCTRHAMVASSGSIFLVGGSHKQLSFSSNIIEYNLSTNEFNIVGNLLLPVRSMDAVAVDQNIIVFGGKKGEYDDGSNDIQCFDLSSRQCYRIQSDLSVFFKRSGAVVVSESVLLISRDGQLLEWTEGGKMRTIMKLNASEFKKSPCKSMCYFDGKLYIVLSKINKTKLPVVVDVKSSKLVYETNISITQNAFCSLMKCTLSKSTFQ